ncbi:MAG TPA: serine/threonine-protein kinase [Arenimonas sp.]|nr:serine/threonine-protein kinase [Arenimonas sp.]
MIAPSDEQARARWLDALLDLDEPERERALADAGIPAEWRETGARLARLLDAEGVLDRDPAAIAQCVLGVETTAAPESEARVGRYVLERLIGEGGMATVWLARHSDASLPQRVAVKCLRTTLSSPQWRGRFLREQTILARFNHSNITRLIDAGITDAGMPYIVMEYVNGLSIGRYCDEHRLGCRERVQLFLKVCDAVAYAHRNLVVHRDLKPSNVLVSADHEPHLLDFGIAKLLDPTELERDFTRTGLVPLTPAYAAPEQFSHGDITTATDVYGLGALLHEVLVGARATHHHDGRLRLPSGSVPDGPAAARGGSTPRLRKLLRGDLDAILQRALRREPELRYAHAGELQADLKRWLDGAPVQARVGNWHYRANKFLRRHWLAMGLIAFAIIGMGLLTALSVRQSTRADIAATSAINSADRALRSRDFVLDLLHDLRPGASLQSPERLIDRAAQLARSRFAADPETRAAVLLSVAELSRGYGRLQQSHDLLQEAADIALSLQGQASELWLDAQAQLGHTAFRRGDYRSGNAALQEALRRYDAAGGKSGAARIRALQILGQLTLPLGDTRTALSLQRQATQSARALLSERDPLRQQSLELYGEALAASGQLDAARRVLLENLAAAKATYGDKDVAVISALETLAVRELEFDQPQQAKAHLLEAKSIADEVLEAPHVMRAYVENSLGVAELRLGNSHSAQQAFERALVVFSSLYEAPHAMLAATHSNRGDAAFELLDYPAAASAYLEEARQREALQSQGTRPAIGAWCRASEALMHAAASHAPDPLQPCRDRLRDAPELGDEYQALLDGLDAEWHWRAGDTGRARALALAALNGMVADDPQQILQPLFVLANLAATRNDAAALLEYSSTALTLTGVAARPCTRSRLFNQLAQLNAALGHSDMARALRDRAQPTTCLSAPQPRPPLP